MTRVLALAVVVFAAAALLSQTSEARPAPPADAAQALEALAPDAGSPGVALMGGAVAASQAAPAPPAGPAAQPSLGVIRPAGRRLTLPYNAPRAAGLGDQCTAYALDRMYQATGLWLRSTGHAGVWGRTAAEAGWTVGDVPAAQSIVVMPYAGGYRYATFASGALARTRVHPEYGHVGWVERLDATGNWALVSDQNWEGTGARGARWLWL